MMDSIQVGKVFADIGVVVVVEMSRRRLETAEEVVEMSIYTAEEEMVGEVMVVVVEGML